MQKGFTIWFTGLSGSGKSTLADYVAEEFRKRNLLVELLDGDVIRNHLSGNLKFSREDRNENVKRVGFVCQLLTRNGIIALASLISPYRESRDYNRQKIKNFVEVYVKCPLEICAARDLKGLYQKSKNGHLQGLTGVDDPYEEPLNPEVICETHQETVEQSAQKIFQVLSSLGYLKIQD